MGSAEDSSIDSEIVQKKFVVLDQTFVVFDIEQPRNAQQKLKINRLTGVGPIYWRFQTNAPTRYMVTPNCGFLRDDDPVEITITLHKNRFSPRHELFLQAIQAPTESDDHKLLNSMFENLEKVQVVILDLGTTVMNIEKAVENNKSNNSNSDLKFLLDANSIMGIDRVKHLNALIKMTTTDIEILANNISQSRQLKIVLETQLEEKKKLVNDMKSKLAMLEASYMRKSAEVDRLVHELSCHQRNAMRTSMPQNNNCTIS